MAARPYWQGQIRLALVAIPVDLYSAARSGPAVPFRQIHGPTGKPIHYEKVVEGVGPVDRDEIVKGYEYEKGEYVLLDEEEIEGVALESRRTLDLNRFVDANAIDPLWFEKPYYVTPTDDLAEEAFVVLREALRKTGKVGLGQLALRGREYVVAVKPCGRGLVLETLRYADEVHEAAPFFRDISNAKLDPEMLDLATSLIEKKAGEFDADDYQDRYGDALRDLVERKLKSKSGKVSLASDKDKPIESMNVVELMKALKKSLDEGEARAGKPAKAAKRAPARSRTSAKTSSSSRTRKRA